MRVPEESHDQNCQIISPRNDSKILIDNDQVIYDEEIEGADGIKDEKEKSSSAKINRNLMELYLYNKQNQNLNSDGYKVKRS